MKLPWGYYNPENGQGFDSIWNAFQNCNRRLLLLGSPGAGKTTALLHLGAELIKEAEASPNAPLPVIVNLSKFRFRRELQVGLYP